MTLKKPPMGWNSWDCYGAAVNETQVRENAEYMAKHLREYGWEYIVVDIRQVRVCVVKQRVICVIKFPVV